MYRPDLSDPRVDRRRVADLMQGINNWGRVLISIIVVIGFLGVLTLILTVKLQGNATPDILLVMLGSLGAAFVQVTSYWVGSSASSSAKDATIQNMVEKT